MVSTAAFHARVWGSVPGLGGFKETKMFLPHPDSFQFFLSSAAGNISCREIVFKLLTKIDVQLVTLKMSLMLRM